jgi:hypothetical protein
MSERNIVEEFYVTHRRPKFHVEFQKNQLFEAGL